jgi:diguanylate cyclase (GGDEF)-like protein
LQKLKSALAANSRQDADSQFCVLMFDLDYFKQINDEWGHLVGDAALIHFCDRLREVSPAGSALGRVGGEEFLLLLARTDGDAATRLSNQLRHILKEKPCWSATESWSLLLALVWLKWVWVNAIPRHYSREQIKHYMMRSVPEEEKQCWLLIIYKSNQG